MQNNDKIMHFKTMEVEACKPLLEISDKVITAKQDCEVSILFENGIKKIIAKSGDIIQIYEPS